MKEAFIVNGFRSPVGKAVRGAFRFTRPDDLAAMVIGKLMDSIPNIDKERIDDLIVGNAMPEAEQGLNFARLISLLALNTDKVPGMTVNRYCASGLETIAIASAKIKAGMANCIIAGGAESMSLIPMGGWKVVPNYEVAKAEVDAATQSVSGAIFNINSSWWHCNCFTGTSSSICWFTIDFNSRIGWRNLLN